ncbi:MAG: glycerol kinase GlpK [Actinomycetia bacterium]|nr:glycerol kinase GlpK [Actinomycetes bacterium]
MEYIAVLDQGTTSSRCVIFDHNANVVSKAAEEIKRYFPHPGWVEQDAMEIWSSQFAMYSKALMQEQISVSDLAAIGITNQRETTIVWNRHTSEPICMAPVWQCRRGAPLIEEWVAAGYGEMIHDKTGLVPDAYFSASKLRWILDNVKDAREGAEAGDLLFGTVDSWLIWKMTDGEVHATDYTNASRTMMFNIHTLQWDDELLEIFDIPRVMLPEVKSSFDIFGVNETGSKPQVPICGVVGDQQAALFAQCCFDKGQAKATYGTGSFVLMNTGSEPVTSKRGLLTTIAFAWQEEGSDELNVTYALEGSVYSAGSALQWLRDGLHLIRKVPEVNELAAAVDDTNGVHFVPAFNGLGAPYWDSEARGTLTGLTQGSTREHIARATLESIAFRVNDVLEAMVEDSHTDITELRVDGGVSNSDFLMQFQADLIGVDVIRPHMVEATALGAAFVAGIATGIWDDQAQLLRIADKKTKTFTPAMDKAEVKLRKKDWARAIKKARA